VLSQNPFFLRTKSENCLARFGVQNVCYELDAIAPPLFEGVAQHEVLRLRIDVGALPPLRKERKADFDSAMVAVDSHEAGATDNDA
jgi:hypothetical protein